MNPFLTKQYVIDLIKLTCLQWEKRPFKFPRFIVELEYINFFSLFIKEIPARKNDNIEPIVEHYLEEPLEKAIKQICLLMDRNTANGTAIWNIISERRLILRRDQRMYNKQVPGKAPKGITQSYWMDYNHWALALAFWKGVLDSQNPDFRVIITSSLIEDSEDPIEVLLANEYKPLWGMWAAFNALGRPLISTGNDSYSINVLPYAAWSRYKEKT